MTITAQDFLMGTGSKTAKFPTVGTSVTGQIVREPEVGQQTEFGTGKPLTWDDGRPRLQLIVQVQTTAREDAEDDGVRSIYVKGKSLTNAVRDAVRKSGAPGLEVGGTLTVTYIGDGKADRGMPPKLYTATYTRPTAGAVNEFLNGGNEPVPVVSTATGQPVVHQQPVPTASVDAPPAGMDPAVWAQMDTDQRAKVRAALGLAQ
ncbi:hypothetical protein AB0I61_17185 [Polymorphospora rubra]|uniref:hypothetical protein n=1 Tax=Polymorphospora rubra TaxID=338584 RepID=UPI00340EA490